MRVSLLALALLGCTGSDPVAKPDASAPCAAQLEWGRNVNGTFTPFRDGDRAQITLGFQGFRFIDGIARIRGVGRSDPMFVLQATLDGQEPSVQYAGPFASRAGEDGAVYVDALQIFFNDVPMPELLGKSVQILVTSDVAGCTARTSARVVLERGGCMDQDGGIAPCDAGP